MELFGSAPFRLPEWVIQAQNRSPILGKSISKLTREELISLARSLAEQLTKLASNPS
jgi:hypothetical protein